MAELKPCPFCGRIPMVEDCGDNRFFVRCKCGIAQDKLYGQRCDAVRRWNTRKPSEDVVEVVRCKDCRWWDICPSSSVAPAYHECHYGAAHRHTTAQDFCSYGVRKDE